MFLLDDATLVLSSTDLTNHLACQHLTQQKLAIARGERGKARPADDPHAELARKRGDEFEARQLKVLSAECGGHVDLSPPDGTYVTTRTELEAACDATATAMREGAPLIFQAQFFDGRWQGRADFLRRVDRPSGLGSWSYELLDTKLARQPKPGVVHQLSLYNRLLARIQGEEPEVAHVVLGDGTTYTLQLRRYRALHRRVVGQFEAVVGAAGVPTSPEPVSHCGICSLASECRDWFVATDHLSLVANARRDQREALVHAGASTVAALATAPATPVPAGLAEERFELLREQAGLQVRSRESGEPCHRHLPPVRAGGYAAVPAPSEGDVFFDLEGDPYVGDGGIEYLWGWWTAQEGYECVWAHDAAGEKAALEAFVDRVVEQRRAYPDLHVYHYAPHEKSKLRSLAAQYATREQEIDELLRDEVLVDLLAVVRQGMQVGEESYSLKKLERHHGFVREERRVREGGGSIVVYEQWLELQEPELLEAIRAYNCEDCISTLRLRDWILEHMRPEAEAEFGVDFADFVEPEPEERRGPPEWMPDVLALVERLTAGLPPTGEGDTPEQAERRLISHLLLYHYRESKPTWWRYFDLRGKTADELIDERDAIAGLVRDETVAPVPFKRSLDYRFTFPAQEHRLGPGDCEDPLNKVKHKVVEVGAAHVVVRRGNSADPPAPVALVDATTFPDKPLREALIELAQSILADDGRFVAVRRLLRREPPRLASGELGESVEQLIGATLGLEESCLPVQGPPGTGKTYRGARMIVAAMKAGKRVGITAPSHAAIKNLLGAVEEHAHEVGYAFSGVYKPAQGGSYDSPRGLVRALDRKNPLTDADLLVAGTQWFYAGDDAPADVHVVFVDEAGQFALANAAVVGLVAENLVLLGDPQQLPQVTQVDHPDGSGGSVLDHVLDGASTIPAGRGVLLTETWRMHPDVCAFVSERSYDGLLHARDACGLRRIDASQGALRGSGLRLIEVAHSGNSQASTEEATAIAAACRDLLGNTATVTDDGGVTRPLTAADLMVVAPYNQAVRCLREHVPDGVAVGTVDRFQGQEAAVVFYSMTCSTGEDVPRGIDFLFDQNRLNVAVSRAQCLAVLVHSPRLLDANCATLPAMELVDGACRFVELATARR